MTKKRIKPVRTLGELFHLAKTDPAYRALLEAAAENLGAPTGVRPETFLTEAAFELGEDAIVDEINFCRDLI